MKRIWARRLLMAVLLLIVPIAVWSDNGQRVDEDEDDSNDHVQAFEALKSGKIVRISKILDYLDENYRGSVVEIELESELVPMMYEVEYLTDDGNFLEFHFDATTGEVRSIRGSGAEKARKKP